MQWDPTAALAVEVLSGREPADKKLGFCAAHRVDELVMIDPDQRTVLWLELHEGAYEPLQRPGVIGLRPAELADRIDWEPAPCRTGRPLTS